MIHDSQSPPPDRPMAGLSRRHLSSHLTLATVLVTALIVAAVSALGYWQTQQTAESHMQNMANSHAAFLRRSLELPLWHLDYQQARTIAAALLQNDEVVHIHLEDAEGREIFDQATDEGPPDIRRQGEIHHQGNLLGRFSISLTMQRFQGETRRLVLNSLFLILAVMLAVALVMGPLLGRLLKRPVNNLLARIDGLAAGDYRRAEEEVVFAELEPVVMRFDRMAQEVRHREDSLTRSRDRLAQEVVQRQQAQEALRLSEERYRRLFDSITDLIYIHDMDGNILSLNQAAVTSLGRPLSELVGRPISSLIAPEVKDEFESAYMSQIRQTGQARGIARYRGRDGAIRFIEYRSLVVREGGQEPQVSGSGRDVTERIQSERELRHLQQQLLQAQKMEALGTLASGVAHEFNNVLMTIRGYTQLMAQRRDLEPETGLYLRRIDESTQRAASLVGGMLGFSRREDQGRTRLEPQQMLEKIEALLRQTLPPSVALDIQVSPEAPPVLAQPNQLEQVLLNLALNARDAMPQGGLLTISAAPTWLDEAFCRVQPWARPGPYLELVVSDSGDGMPPEVVERIFEPFFTTKLPGKGTGLGLYVAYTVLRNHDGGIVLESRPGQGATFRLYLPALAGQAQAESPAEPPTPPVPGQGQRILVVDDEPAVRQILREALTGAGYQVEDAADGQEALELYQARSQAGRPFDLVVLDLSMPVMDGLECLRRLTELDDACRVVLATGQADGHLAQKAARAKAILRKPFDLADLLRLLAGCLTPENGAQATKA
ncbi:MAG: response regulator [Desulfarculus sp.]|nr:response regulator [Desulfarculus sp.]